MDKTIKYLFKIVIFPITIIFYFFKYIYKWIDKKITGKYLLKLDINSVDSLDGKEFEEFLYYSFRSLGLNVTRTQTSRDYGADLVIKIKDQVIVIQSKLYFNHNVGNSAVQEIATARNYYRADIGMVITNSYFTKSAYSLAESNGITLIDRKSLSEFLISDSISKKEMIDSWLYQSYS